VVLVPCAPANGREVVGHLSWLYLCLGTQCFAGSSLGLDTSVGADSSNQCSVGTVLACAS
jgi:hypothetical protein